MIYLHFIVDLSYVLTICSLGSIVVLLTDELPVPVYFLPVLVSDQHPFWTTFLYLETPHPSIHPSIFYLPGVLVVEGPAASVMSDDHCTHWLSVYERCVWRGRVELEGRLGNV